MEAPQATFGDLSDVAIGDSIAVSGCCLTVTYKQGQRFTTDLSDETLRLTTFAHARAGQSVNLERALRFSDRLGGHLVTGHVDAIGKIVALTPKSGSLEIALQIPAELIKYVVHKGSIAIDGVSLTVSLTESDRRRHQMRLYIIPHTEEKTTLPMLKVGDTVNIEVDYLAKLVENLTVRPRP